MKSVGLKKYHYENASGGDGIPVDLFQILKDDAVKVLESIWQQIWKTEQWPQSWEMPVFTPIPKEGNAKGCSSYCTIVFISAIASTCISAPTLEEAKLASGRGFHYWLAGPCRNLGRSGSSTREELTIADTHVHVLMWKMAELVQLYGSTSLAPI